MKMKNKLIPVFVGYVLGVLFARISYIWSHMYTNRMIDNIPDPGYPVKLICFYILNHFGWYTLGVVAVFVYVMYVWSRYTVKQIN